MAHNRAIHLFITLLLFVYVHVDVVSTSDLHPLVFQGFLPMTGTGWPGGGACLPAVSMAIRDINARQGLLDGYNMTYTWVDTQVTERKNERKKVRKKERKKEKRKKENEK